MLIINYIIVGRSPKRSERLRTKKQLTDNDDLSAQGMSLDVLAHVASETLKQEPETPQEEKHIIKKVK